MRKIITAFFLLFSVTAYPQLGSFTNLSFKTNLDQHWGLFAEGQIRSLRFYDDFHYYEFKVGANYNIRKNFSLQAGLGKYDTYNEGGNFKTPILNDEYRSWIQFTMKQNLESIKFEHRYRAEQRWTSNGFKNRFRYRLQAVIPLNSKKLEAGTFYAAAWNELFFTNKAPYFERNRMFGGFGYEFNNNFALQTGFIHQYDYKLTDEIGRNFLQISFLYEFAIKKNKQEHIPEGIE